MTAFAQTEPVSTARPHAGGAPFRVLLAVIALAAPALAQSAASFHVPATPETPPQPTAQAAPAESAPKPKAASAELEPSRYILPEEQEAYVLALGTNLIIKDKDTDPFGQYQDPDAKPLIRTPAEKTRRTAPSIKATPFSDIVSLIRVSTVMPKENMFLIGDREVHVGQKIPVTFRGRGLTIQVSAVTSSEIEFRNTETEETASLKLNLLPQGMTPGADGLVTAPGMVPKNDRAPIQLDSDIPNSESHLTP